MTSLSSQSSHPQRGQDRVPMISVFWLVAILGVVSLAAVLAAPSRESKAARMWTFARLHHQLYVPVIQDWNSKNTLQVDISLLGVQAVEQRMLSSFLTRTSGAELLEVERRSASRAFAGPLDGVGFLDLTDRIKAEGLDKKLNPASFTPWSTQGRIFGLPHDVHPVMLGYRADIVEAAGIDVSQIETWDDFQRVLGPLLYDQAGQRRSDRYLLNLWETHMDTLEVLLLQAGGGVVDSSGMPALDQEINARVIAHAAAWTNGPNPIAADAPYFSASGNRLLLDGFVIASFVPDWMCNIWRNEIPQLSGKVKLMPMPAWEKGSRRTSVWGGSMLGISRDAKNHEELWDFAKHLYLSKEMARELYITGDIVTPVVEYWSDPIFDRTDAYFSGQSPGRMYINLATQVPPRYSSPFSMLCVERLRTVAGRMATIARQQGNATPDSLFPEAKRLLAQAQDEVMEHAKRNRFISPADVASSTNPHPHPHNPHPHTFTDLALMSGGTR
jgi:arabinosaccharide transport system substrate-binding protein